MEAVKLFTGFERVILGIGVVALITVLLFADTVFSEDIAYGVADRVAFVFISCVVLLLVVMYAFKCIRLQVSGSDYAQLKVKGRMLRANLDLLLLNPNLNLDQRNLIKKNIRLIDSGGDPFSGESRYQHTDHYKDGESHKETVVRS